MGGPVIACGYQRQDKFEGLLLVRGQTPAGPPRQVRALDGGIQECIPFIALGVHTDLGISGAPLLNPLTGYVEGIVAGVDTNEAESKLGLQPQVQAFSAPLDDVQLRWPEFGKECDVRPYSPVEDIVEQGEEFFRHGAPSRLTARQLWTKHVDEFLNDPERKCGYLLLLAGPGSGKSSFTVQYATSSSVSPICYFLRDGESAWDAPRRMLLSLAERLWMEYGAPARYQLPELLTQIREGPDRSLIAAQLLRDTLDHVSLAIRGVGRRVVLWIDGLDEVFGPGKGEHDTPRLRQLLPESLPDGVFIVLTSRPGDHLDWLSDPRFCARHWLDDATAERAASVRDIEQYLTNQVEEANLRPEPDWIGRAAQRTEGNFYVAYLMFERIRRSSDAPENPDDLPASVQDFHDRILRDVVAAAGKRGILERDVRTTLAILALAAEPMALEHLQALSAPDSAEEVLSLAADWLVPRPPRRAPELPFEFNHSSVREFLVRRLTLHETLAVHATLARACARWSDFADDGVRHYALRHRFEHLVSARLWDDVAAAFGEAGFIVEMAKRCGFHEVHRAAHRTMRAPGLPEGWRKPFEEWEKFVRWRIECLTRFPEAYAQEVVNEFLPTARKAWGVWLSPLESARGILQRVPLTKLFGPPPMDAVGHAGRVSCIACSPDGKTIASGALDGAVKVWEVATGRLQAECRGHRRTVLSVAFSPDGRRLATGGGDGTVRIWDVQTGRLVADCRGHQGCINKVALHPSGGLAASASDDKTVRVWQVETGDSVHILQGHEKPVNTVAFSPDGRRVVSGSDDSRVMVWDTQLGHNVVNCLGCEGNVSSVAVSLDGRYIAAGGVDPAVRVWDAETGFAIAVCMPSMADRPHVVVNVAFSPDGQYVAAGDMAMGVNVWTAATGKLVSRCAGHKEADFGVTVAFSCDGKLIASGGSDGAVKVWDPHTGNLVADCLGHTDVVSCVAFSPRSRYVVSGSYDRSIRVWKPATGQLVTSCKGQDTSLTSAACAGDGRHAAFCDGRSQLKVYATPTARLVLENAVKCGSVEELVFSPNGRLLAAGSAGPIIWVWNVAAGRVAAHYDMRDLDCGVSALAFSPNSRYLACGFEGDPIIRIWDLRRDALPVCCKGHRGAMRATHTLSSAEVTFHTPDGQILRVPLAEQSRLWRTPDKGQHGGGVNAVSFSPDGRRIASGGVDSAVKMWNSRTGQLLADCRRHKGEVTCVAFSPDGRHVASGSSDTSVKIWDGTTGSLVADCCEHRGRVAGIVFSRDGHRLASTGSDHTIRIWDADAGRAIAVCRGHQPDTWEEDMVSYAGGPDLARRQRGGGKRVTFSPDGKYVIAPADDSTVRVWDAASGACAGLLFVGTAVAGLALVGRPLYLMVLDRLGRVYGYSMREGGH
jgi:WD40 repeat protein